MKCKTCSKIVGIKNRTFAAEIRLSSEKQCNCKLAVCPSMLQFLDVMQEGNVLKLRFYGMDTGRANVQLTIDGESYTIPAVVFNEREFFLCMVISSNYHDGFEPEAYVFGDEMHQIGGHAFYKACRTLGALYHQHSIPVTWLIDPVVAREGAELIKQWHQVFHDDYGVMPSSYFNHNKVNYNLQHIEEETLAFMRSTLEGVEENFPFYTEIAGIDQWVGSIGTHFVKACRRLKLKGVWGIGYDHFTCDTSMFHRGCPWDAYKPDVENFRIPSADDSDQWIFQWTSRDIINTVHTPTGNSGSVIFSTDPDDIRQTGIMQSQADYFDKMLQQYMNNCQYNSFATFLMHQEDHDMHFEEDNTYMERFLKNIPGGVTYATLNEVLGWLNLKYAPAEHPVMKLSLEDILACRQNVIWGYGGVEKPADWGDGEEKYTLHGAFYNRDMQIILQKPYRKPLRVFDYSRRHACPEEGIYPEEAYGNVTIVHEEFCMKKDCWIYQARIVSDVSYTAYPLVIWDFPQEIGQTGEDSDVVATKDFLVLFVELKEGRNEVEVTCPSSLSNM